MFLTVHIPETRPCPSYPALCVLPEPGGATRSPPRPLLIKPDRTLNEIIQGLLGDGKAFRAEMIAQKIKSSLGPAHQCLIRVLFQLQFIECLVEHPDGFLEFPPGGSQYQNVVHVPKILDIQPFHLPIQIQKIESAQKG